MLHYLKQSRKFVNSTESICIILGNESCDLDSAVCAITLAYHYQKQQEANNTEAQNFLPVLNIPRCDYPLKTEVKYALSQHSISIENLTFRDELHEDFLARSKFILVDHHVSPFAARCLEVFDHRAFDEQAQLPSDCRKHIELVGSCATLIAEQLLTALTAANRQVLELYEPAIQMLRCTIILDTVNFSATANRATLKDVDICNKLEQLLSKLTVAGELKERKRLFEELVAARADISSLSALELLRKDLKVLSNREGNVSIALPGFPMLVQQFVQKPDAASAVIEFAKQLNAQIVLLMGMLVTTDGSVQRDLGFIDMGACKLCAELREKLLCSTDPALNLEKYDNIDFINGHFFKMKNIKATRKHILPLVKQLLDKWEK